MHPVILMPFLIPTLKKGTDNSYDEDCNGNYY